MFRVKQLKHLVKIRGRVWLELTLILPTCSAHCCCLEAFFSPDIISYTFNVIWENKTKQTECNINIWCDETFYYELGCFISDLERDLTSEEQYLEDEEICVCLLQNDCRQSYTTLTSTPLLSSSRCIPIRTAPSSTDMTYHTNWYINTEAGSQNTGRR